MSTLQRALGDLSSGYAALQPPSRLSVAEGVAKSFYIKKPGAEAKLWDPTETPHMVDPLNAIGDRRFSAVVFVGPAQDGKTAALVEGFLAHAVLHDPGDMGIFQMTQDKAREFSKQRIDRGLAHSPQLAALMSRRFRDDNTHDKMFLNGMWVRIAWPTRSNLASTSYRYVVGTDLDRWPDNIEGEGDGFTLMRKRTTAFMSRGKTVVESSPGRPITSADYVLTTPHEAPPVGGILGIYNLSDRRRRYWKCAHCGDWFEAAPGLSLFNLPEEEKLRDGLRTASLVSMASQYARIIHRACGVIIPSSEKAKLDLHGRWLPEGIQIDNRDRLSGSARESDIAGFWAGGVTAAYLSWENLLLRYLQALLEFDLTGNEEKLQSTINTDQAAPYLSRHLEQFSEARSAKQYDETLERFVAPEWTRFLLAAVDIQGGKYARFEIQVHAIGEDGQEALVDRFALRDSTRAGLGTEFAPIDPAGYAEDWDLLTEKVLNATYRTPTEGQELRVFRVMVDSGGESGVTSQAYAWRARIARHERSNRVFLTKGEDVRDSPWLIKPTVGVGGVPLLRLNSNRLKDIVHAGLQRTTLGPGFYCFPRPKEEGGKWLPQNFFDELRAERRDSTTGKWSQVKPANESFDLCYMIKAARALLGCDTPGFWANPPSWARPLHLNSEVVSAAQRREEKKASRGRSVSHRSSYLG